MIGVIFSYDRDSTNHRPLRGTYQGEARRGCGRRVAIQVCLNTCTPRPALHSVISCKPSTIACFPVYFPLICGEGIKEKALKCSI